MNKIISNCFGCDVRPNVKGGISLAGKGYYWVSCSNIECKIKPCTDSAETPDGAISLWNKRCLDKK